MSSELWGDPATFCRSLQICWPTRRTVLVLGELLCLGSFLTFFSAPAKAAIGAGASELRTQASQIAQVEQVQWTNGRKKYHWYAKGWNGPGYYEVGDAWKTGVGWGGGVGGGSLPGGNGSVLATGGTNGPNNSPGGPNLTNNTTSGSQGTNSNEYTEYYRKFPGTGSTNSSAVRSGFKTYNGGLSMYSRVPSTARLNISTRVPSNFHLPLH